MKFSIRFADQIVGALVILALAILIVVIFMLGRSQRWFVKDFEYKTYFNSASGLSPNMAILYKGFTIGHIKKITLAQDDTVEVIFTIFEEHNHRVKEGTVVELQASPIGLGNAFHFYPGLGAGEIAEGSVIPEINSPQARALIARGLVNKPESSDSIGNIINNVSLLLETLNIALAGSPGAEDLTIGQIVKNLERTIANVNEIVQSLSGQIDPILSQIDPILTDVGTMVGDLSGQIGPIISNVETISDQLASPTGTVMSLLDAEGPVFTSIAEVLSSITAIIRNLERTIEFIPAQLPQISFLLSDLSSTLTEVEKLIIALNNNPLLRGGVPEIKETGPGAVTPRDLEF
jgi:phospholipid/cholesterol/gamma-HCH transport system substrate-binding protein